MLSRYASLGLCALVSLLHPSSARAQDESPEIDLGEPDLVGPGIVSGPLSESGGTLTPDGETLYYMVTDRAFTHMTIVRSTLRTDGWNPPEIAPFSGTWNDSDPFLSPDGRRLFFISNRTAGGAAGTDLDVWYVERGDDDWGPPVPVEGAVNGPDYEVYPSVAEDGTLYFARPGGTILRAPLVDGAYPRAEPLPLRGGSPAIAPDQSFLILARSAPENPADTDLYVSFHRDGDWTAPRRLANPVNSPYGETAPRVTADGATLLFSSDRVDYGAFTWPRPRPLASFDALRRELEGTVENGLRNLYRVDLRPMLEGMQARARDPAPRVDFSFKFFEYF